VGATKNGAGTWIPKGTGSELQTRCSSPTLIIVCPVCVCGGGRSLAEVLLAPECQ